MNISIKNCLRLILSFFIFHLSCSEEPTSTVEKEIIEEVITVTDIDSNVYKTVKIGKQLWMAENLKVTHYQNGDPIPNIADNVEWSSLSFGAYASYNNRDIDEYGLLYNWYAVDDIRNIAPLGWRVPTDEDWKELEDSLGIDAGAKMKETGIRHWYPPNNEATNESGFTGLPGGHRNDDGKFYNQSFFASFWTSTEDINLSWYRTLGGSSEVGRSSGNKLYGFSIRCIKN